MSHRLIIFYIKIYDEKFSPMPSAYADTVYN